MTYKEKLLDPRWQKKRLEIFNRDGFSCWWCGDKETTLHLHHEAYSGSNPWEAPDYCLITICAECHDVEHYPLTALEKILIDSFRNTHMRDYEKIKLLNRIIKSNREKTNG